MMKPMRGKLPELVEAIAESDKARAEWVKAYAEWEAYAELVKAYAELAKALRHPSVFALHAKECPNCSWNGTSIFGEK